MKNFLRKNSIFIALLIVLLVNVVVFGAERYPVRSLNNIVFSSAGGGTDVINRFLASKLEPILKQRMIVSNMPGGLGGHRRRICLGTKTRWLYGAGLFGDGYYLFGE